MLPAASAFACAARSIRSNVPSAAHRRKRCAVWPTDHSARAHAPGRPGPELPHDPVQDPAVVRPVPPRNDSGSNGRTNSQAGSIALALLPVSAPVWVSALPLIPVGLGGPLVMPPTTAVLPERVPAEQTGTASGVFNTSRQIGGCPGRRRLRRTGLRHGRPPARTAHQPHPGRRRRSGRGAGRPPDGHRSA
ncbi:MFS transporter [Streptomyces sp. NPDC001212]